MSATEIQAITGLVVAIASLLGVIRLLITKAPAKLDNGQSLKDTVASTQASQGELTRKAEVLQKQVTQLNGGGPVVR